MVVRILSVRSRKVGASTVQGMNLSTRKRGNKVIGRPRVWVVSTLQGRIKLIYAIRCTLRQGSGAGNIALGGVLSFLTTRNLIWGRHGALLHRSGSLPHVTEWMKIAAEQRGVKRATYEKSLGRGTRTPTGDRDTKIFAPAYR